MCVVLTGVPVFLHSSGEPLQGDVLHFGDSPQKLQERLGPCLLFKQRQFLLVYTKILFNTLHTLQLLGLPSTWICLHFTTTTTRLEKNTDQGVVYALTIIDTPCNVQLELKSNDGF